MNNKETALLGKLVETAKRGTVNEKKTAIRFIKKLCEKHDLDYEDVMEKKELQEFELDFKMLKFKKLAEHIYARYGIVDKNDYSVGFFVHVRTKMWYKTTLSKHIEMLNAFDVLHKIFEKELQMIKESFELAFVNKHKLWMYVDEIKDRQQPTAEEIKKSMLAAGMEGKLQDAQIMKRLENNN